MNQDAVMQIKSRGGRSKVWNYFGSLYANDTKIDDDLLHCIPCASQNKQTHYKSGSSTSAFIYHLRKEHEISINDLSECERRTENIFNPKYVPATEADRKSVLGRRTGLWMCIDARPAALYGSEGFLQWCLQTKVIAKKEDFPTPRCITTTALNDVYAACKLKVNLRLQTAPAVISVMIDMWTDAYAKVPYINLNVQFLTQKWELVTIGLCTKRFDHPHTAVNISKIVMTTLADFNLANRKFFLTGDGGANVVASHRLMPNCISYIKCLAHCLHLLLSSDLLRIESHKTVDVVMKKIKRTHGKLAYRTTELKNAYREAQREDVNNYLAEWEESLTEQIQANEEIAIGFEEFQNQRVEQQYLAEAGQEPFTAFKSLVETRWTSKYVMVSSYDKNLGKD